MYKKNSCKVCFKNGKKISQRCEHGKIWWKCETCEKEGKNESRRRPIFADNFTDFHAERRPEDDY